MSIEQFTKEAADDLAGEVVKALGPLCKRHGLTVRDAGGKYDDGAFTARFEFKVANADEKTFRKYAKGLGVEPDDFGREVELSGERYRLVGVRISSKYAITVERLSDGKILGYTPEAVERALYPERVAARKREAAKRRAAWEAAHPEWKRAS